MVNEKDEKLSIKQEIISVVFMILITGLFFIFFVIPNYETKILLPFVMVFSVTIGMGISKRISK